MLDKLQFVQGGIARKDIVPVLKHYRISDGRVFSYNGVLALSAPIDIDLDVMPEAGKFYRALQVCEDTVSLHVTPAGRLAVTSGSFKAYVECSNADFPQVEPEGRHLELSGKLLPALRSLSRFISDDASRPWSRGVLLVGGSAYATNNIILVEQWLGYAMPQPVNIPVVCVDELLRINEEPVGVQVSETSITFHFDGERWLRSQLLDLSWPNVAEIVDVEHDAQPLPGEVFQACETLSPFTDKDGKLYFNENTVGTNAEDDVGAHLDIPCQDAQGIYHAKQFLKLKGIATSLDWSCYPKPCAFFGDKLRGVIVGMRNV